jgi:hypothetical protein
MLTVYALAATPKQVGTGMAQQREWYVLEHGWTGPAAKTDGKTASSSFASAEEGCSLGSKRIVKRIARKTPRLLSGDASNALCKERTE